MNGVNRVLLVGTLGNDPQKHTTKDGRAYATLSLATNRYSKAKEDGKSDRKTDWHRIMVWGKKAELCLQFLQKGSPVCVEGHITTYESEVEGKKRWHTSISAEDVHFLPRSQQMSAS